MLLISQCHAIDAVTELLILMKDSPAFEAQCLQTFFHDTPPQKVQGNMEYFNCGVASVTSGINEVVTLNGSTRVRGARHGGFLPQPRVPVKNIGIIYTGIKYTSALISAGRSLHPRGRGCKSH